MFGKKFILLETTTTTTALLTVRKNRHYTVLYFTVLHYTDHNKMGYKTSSSSSHDDISQALLRMADAIRNVMPLLMQAEDDEKTQQQQQQQQHDNKTTRKPQHDRAINASWLFSLLEPIKSSISTSELARIVYETSRAENQEEQQIQETLFGILGESEESLMALMEIVPNLGEIKNCIRIDDLMGETSTEEQQQEKQDPILLQRQRLREEYYDLQQVALLAQAEVDSLGLGSTNSTNNNTTHTITRKSEIDIQKAARKAQKRANQAYQRAKSAGALLEEEDMLQINQQDLGQGGLINQTHEQLQALQSSLLPEGSRQHYNEQGLPTGTIREDNDKIGYEKVTIPPPTIDQAKLHARLRIRDVMDTESAKAFDGTTSLNPMQSTVFDTAFHRRENMLVCAPTGAGKTNVAMLTVVAHFRDVGLIQSTDGEKANIFETAGSKVVYIAPMKALAQEVVSKFSSKLKSLKLIVRELTGDMQLTRAEAESANVIVTTPGT
jgi:hypothetical protein